MTASLIIGSLESEFLRVSPRAASSDEPHLHREGWVRAYIDARVGGFSGAVSALLRIDDFPSFESELSTLYEHLSGKAQFSTLEGWLTITVIGDGKGHFEAECELLDDPSFPNRLRFGLHFDQTQLPPMLKSLAAISASLPGSPAA